jgi:hypothetical protein
VPASGALAPIDAAPPVADTVAFMANFRTLVRRFPAILDYPGSRKWVRRGDVLVYTPRFSAPSLSTDEAGFRHTTFQGRNVGIGDIAEYPRVGLLLGSSHVFGVGLASNAETLASQLSAILGYPFLNLSLPEADSRTLHSILLRHLRTYERKFALAIVLGGGDFTRYCFTRRSDPLFGPPSLPLPTSVLPADDSAQIAHLLQFCGFWTQNIAALSAQVGVPLVFVDDTTFFEKSLPDECERDCDLGRSSAPGQQARFEAHRDRYPQYAEHRRRFAGERKLRLLDFPPPDDLLFIDEYHYRAESQALIATRLVEQLG